MRPRALLRARHCGASIGGMKVALSAPGTVAAAPALAPQPLPRGQRMDAYQAQAASRSAFAALLVQARYLDAAQRERLHAAYAFAHGAHDGQWRSSGEPYITHPVAVACLCAAWRLDIAALMAALLHDCMEDCGITRADLCARFGSTVADLVEGLTKLDKLQFTSREENQAESFRKMLLAMAHDVRVILVKLADRTHNMRTMGDMPRSKWQRISSETLEIYAPIAHRLGLNQTYRELQDLAFCHLHPWRYETLQKALARWRTRRSDMVQRVQAQVHAEFERLHLPMRLAPRERGAYSLYQHMRQRHTGFTQATDVCRFRLLVPRAIDCYTALGVLHQLYKPMPGRFKDHIAIAKKNGYQSLHTTLIGPASVRLDFHIRTDPMELVAESGVAAYWMQQQPGEIPPQPGMQWLQSLLDIQDETRDAAEFFNHIKLDLFPDAVYVFTPKGDILAMPRGATVVDFAYAIHSSVGDHMTAAHVNHTPTALRTELKSGDHVRIITADGAQPDPAWLGFVKTGRARSKIRHYLKSAAQAESERLGHSLLEQALRAKGLAGVPAAADGALWDELLRSAECRSRSDLLADIGMGRRIAALVAMQLAGVLARHGHAKDALRLTREQFDANAQASQGVVLLDGSQRSFIHYAPCCQPVPGDAVIGYLGSEGLLVHHARCRQALRLQEKEAQHLIAVDWADDIDAQQLFDATLRVTVHNAKGVLARVAAVLADNETDILRIHMDDAARSDTAELRFVIAVRNVQQILRVQRSLRQVQAVVQAVRAL